MQEVAKLVPVVVLLTASVSVLAQELAVSPETKRSSQKGTTIDPKTREEMRTTAREMDKQLQGLKTCLDHERSATKSGLPPPEEQGASDAQIQALEMSIRQLREQLDGRPQYLDQSKNPLRP